MAILEIKKFKSPVLRKGCEEVENITSQIEELVFDMVETMKKNRGVGLAAPQVGESKRVVVIQPNPRKQEFLAVINPKIIKKSKEEDLLEEGCLSFPDIFINISRPREIEIEALDIKGNKIKMQAKGFLSHVFQHEIDHLNGVLFFDRLGLFEKIKFKLKNLWRL